MVVFVCLANGLAFGVPFISPQGVVSSASFTAPSLPGGCIAQGSIFSIFGRELGPAEGVQATSFPLPDEFEDVRVTIEQGETTVHAILLFVRADQINAIVPSSAPLGRVIVRVHVGSLSSNGIPAKVVESAVGLFAINSAGFGPGIIQNLADDGSATLNTPLNAAFPGQLLILWGTGLSAVEGPDNVPPTPVDLPVDTDVFIGGALVEEKDLLYAGRSGCCAGLDQFVVRVPLDAALGCYSPVDIRTNGEVMSNAVTMAIAEQGRQCSDTASPFGDTFVDPARVGMMMLLRLDMSFNVDFPEPLRFTSDFALAVMSDQRPGAPLSVENGDSEKLSLPGVFFFNSIVSLPPPGTCLLTNRSALDVLEFPAERKLDPGNRVRLVGPEGVTSVELDAVNMETIGATIPGVELGSLRLTAGEHQVSSTAGSDIGAFATTVTMPTLPDWTNREEIGVIDRSETLRITWSAEGQSNRAVAAAVTARDFIFGSATAVLCAENAEAGVLEIPSRYLETLPASGEAPLSSESAVLVGTAPQFDSGAFEADGLDAGVGVGVAVSGKTVILE